ncbi:motility associated factor glycosyltransferase family protein [Clostridium tyrobutyricum]|uniref:motility associated factor glycosyltransferase family protein n=1 Tax=Clostridium tyrobutyricum TaxID=1519 RepID=UPI00189DD656|nr:6-hydroxymethylpterin diphosphokinase MptE-like protein [Clostridium tyrobutyricum]
MTKAIYEKNMKLIKKLNFYLYDKMKKVELKSVKKIMTKNHLSNISKNIDTNHFMIHSQYDPRYQAKFIAKNVFEDSHDVIFLFGLGLGYELKEMIKLNKDVRYFIIEPDEEIFKILLEIYDIKFLFKNMNIHFILGNNSEDIGKFYDDVIGFEKSLNIKFVVLPSYQIMYKDLINSIFLNIREKINVFKININTEIVSHRQWFQNYIGNLKYLNSTCPVTKLKENFKGKPAIIVSAGSSLNYNIEMLRKLQGKILISAAGSAISILENKGIKSDIVCMIDGWADGCNLIKNINLNKDIALFYSNTLYYKIPSKFHGPKFLININDMDREIYDRVQEKPFNMFSGPSVANCLAYNLSELGCNPIIFLGQDFCYSSEKNYAEGAIYEKDMSEILKNNKYINVKDKNNEDVYTTSVFLSMKTSMEFCIKLHPNIEYLNGTVNGLSIKGTKNIDFNEYAKSTFNRKDCLQIEDTYNEFIDNEANIKKFKYMKNNFEDDNIKLINLLKTSIMYIKSEVNQEKIYKYVKEVYIKLSNIELYKNIIEPNLKNLNFIYKNKDYNKKNEQKFLYILDKCLIMDNAFTYILKGGK